MVLTLGYNDMHPFSKVRIVDRKSVQELLKTVLDPLEPFFSPQKARVRVPGNTGVRFDETASEVEGFCRPLWGLAFLVAGGGTYEHTNLWVQGLKEGVDPQSAEYWGFPLDNDQRMVEMCPLGVALAMAPGIWEQLSDFDRLNVEQWLGNSINSKSMPDTNWLWFRVFANLGLKKNCAKYSQERLSQDIERLETFYHGDGWSNDGPDHIHQMDYYSTSFAIQTLQLIYVRVEGEEDLLRAAEFKRRAQLVAMDMINYFDDEGRAIPFGRSTIYRFAVVAFWCALALADVDLPPPLTWGMVKGIVLRHLRWWQTQPKIWSGNGTLTIGFSYPNMYMAEKYNSPGSPYWACLAFICLAVAEDHPFWTSVEEDISRDLPAVKAIKHPKHITSRLGGHTMLLSSGQACGYPMKGTHAKYGAFAYSSAFGFSVPAGCFTLGQYALASQLGLSDDDGETWKTRRVCKSADLEQRDGTPVLISVWAPFADTTVKTFSVPPMATTPNWHLRIHRVEAGRDMISAEGSFAIHNAQRSDGRSLKKYDAHLCEGTSPLLLEDYDDNTAEASSAGQQGSFAVSKGAVGIKALEAHGSRTAMLVNADPNTNLLESRTVIPTLKGSIKKEETVWYITAIYAKPEGGSVVAREAYLDGWTEPPKVPAWITREFDR